MKCSFNKIKTFLSFLILINALKNDKEKRIRKSLIYILFFFKTLQGVINCSVNGVIVVLLTVVVLVKLIVVLVEVLLTFFVVKLVVESFKVVAVVVLLIVVSVISVLDLQDDLLYSLDFFLAMFVM
jgi:hypothetical protein